MCCSSIRALKNCPLITLMRVKQSKLYNSLQRDLFTITSMSAIQVRPYFLDASSRNMSNDYYG